MKKMKNYLMMLLVLLLNIPNNVLAAPEQIPTEDTKDFLDIKLFDYDANDQGNGDVTTGINATSPLKFRPSQYGYEEQGSSRDLKNALQGIVKPTLSNGYPVLSDGIGNSNGGKSLDVLFNTETISGKTVYSGVNHLFKKDEKGNLVFDSNSNYAYYNNNTKNFEVYKSTFNVQGSTDKIGFFPFDEYNESKTNVNPQGDNGYNHFFGVTISNEFTYPEDGKNNGEDMFLDFSGDDDVWVFIDDVLVLDIGGIHSAVEGSINLTDGKVSVKNASSLTGATGTMGTSNTIDALFAAAGKEFDRGANTKHKFKFFYLERGSTYSNMKLETNIWRIIEKEDIPEEVVEPTPTTGTWTVKFYKDDKLQDTQNCTYYSTDKKCRAGDIKNPGKDTYYEGSCSGKKVSKVESLVVSKNMDLYTCSPAKKEKIVIKEGPPTGVRMLVFLAMALSITSILLSRNSLKKEINDKKD